MNGKLTENGHNDGKEEVDVLKEDEEVEVWMVLDSNAVVDPLAMMIESLNTLIADVAVAWVSRAYDFTVRTE